MASNPFDQERDDRLRGCKVRAIDVDGREYIGWAIKWDYYDDNLLLRAAKRVDDGDVNRAVGTVYVAHPRAVESVEEQPVETIEQLSLEDVAPGPFASREFDRHGNHRYIRQVRDREFVGTYPVVREMGGHYEIVEGHKRLWVCQQAGLTSHPFEIVDVDDREAARLFAMDHLPSPEDAPNEGSSDGWYDRDEARRAIERMVDRIGGEVLSWPSVWEAIEAYDLHPETGLDESFDWIEAGAGGGEQL